MNEKFYVDVKHDTNYRSPLVIWGANFDEIIEEIESYGQLPNGWSYGEGIPANRWSILNAKYVYDISKAYGFGVEPHPELDGSISLIIFKDDYFLEVEVSESKKLKLRLSKGKGDSYKLLWKDKQIDISKIDYELIAIKIQCQNITSYALWTSSATTPTNKKNLGIMFLASENQEQEYLCSATIVQSKDQEIFVPI